ncbi:MAG TPA: methyltransferase [Bdellovibrionales bacterium]|nr:methyltransferase [Bdellovibrionales bacterium]
MQIVVKYILIAIYVSLSFWAAIELVSERSVLHMQTFLIRLIFLWAVWRIQIVERVDLSVFSIFITFLHFAFPMAIEYTPGLQTSFSWKLGQSMLALGFLAAAFAALDLNRSFGLLPSRMPVVSSGVYALIRHPMYLGYLLLVFGSVCMVPSMWNISAAMMFVALTHIRIILEEKMMNQDRDYRDYAATVHYRLVPKVY